MGDTDATTEAPRRSGEPLAFRIAAGSLLLLVALLGWWGFDTGGLAGSEFLVWVAALLFSHLLVVPVAPRQTVEASVGSAVAVAAAVVLAPSMAMLAVLFGVIHPRELRGQVPFSVSIYNRSQIALSAGAAAFLAHVVPGGPLVATLVAVPIYDLVNSSFVTVALVLRRRADVLPAVAASTRPIPSFALEFLMTGALAGIVIVTYDQLGILALALLVPPLFLAYSAIRSARTAEDRAEKLAVRLTELEAIQGAGAELVGAASATYAAEVVQQALRTQLDFDRAIVALDGVIPLDLETIKVQGVEPAAIGVPPDLNDEARGVAESIAQLLGLALTRLALEEELAEVQRARARLAQQLIEEGTRERSRLALSIHDDVLPTLAAGQMHADLTQAAIDRGRLDRVRDLSGTTAESISRGIGLLREVVSDLRKQVLVPGGLEEAVGDLLADTAMRSGVKGTLHIPEPLPELPLAVEILLLETVRGALANVANHSAADNVRVEVAATDTSIRLEVRDDGSGFDPDQVPEGHHGLVLMRQRVELARGRFVVDSAPGAGARIALEVPL